MEQGCPEPGRDKLMSGLRAAMYVLFFLAGLLHLDYGLPEVWANDELGAVVHRMAVEDDFNPRFFNYPSGLLVHSAHFLVLAWQYFEPSLVVDLSTSLHACRIINLVFFMLTLYCIEGTIRVLFRRRHALFALLMGGTTCGLLHHAHLGAANPGFFFGISLAVYQFCRTLKSHKALDFYLSVAACSFAVGCKYNAVHLFLAAPVVWLCTFRPWRWSVLFTHLTISTLVAPLAFFITNPFVCLDAAKALNDIHAVAVKEAPWFQETSSVSHLLGAFVGNSKGFFSPLGMYVVFVVVALGALVFVVRLAGRRRYAFFPQDTLATKAQVMVAVLAVAYAALAYRIGIFQSRYIIPMAMYCTTAFLIFWYWLPALLSGVLTAYAAPSSLPRTAWVRRACTGLQGGLGAVLCVVFVCTGIAQVYAFSSDPRALATRYVLETLAREPPETRVGLITYGAALPTPGRSGLQRGHLAIEPRVREFRTMCPPLDDQIDTWDKYLHEIQKFVEDKETSLLVLEDIIMKWTVFLPKKHWHDYSNRFKFPNPGPEEWYKTFAAAGFRPACVVSSPDKKGRCMGRREAFPRLLHCIIGTHYLRIAEGRGGDVHVFVRDKSGNVHPAE
jgi:hypothetical protein